MYVHVQSYYMYVHKVDVLLSSQGQSPKWQYYES